jgi:peptide/nickel transport system permease protein
MFAYVVKRLLSGVVVLFLVSLSIFLLFWYGPKDPARPLCDFSTSNRCNNERLAEYTHDLGYDKSWYSQYGIFAKGIFVGRDVTIRGSVIKCGAPCFGVSYTTQGLVWQDMKKKLPATISVAVGGGFLYLAFGIPLGVAAARRRGTMSDKALVSSFLVISSVPYYLFALLLWLYISTVLNVPYIGDTGYTPITSNPAKWFSGLLLAWICLGIFGCTSYTRYTRGAMVESLQEDYTRTAKAKGLPARRIVYKHALRAALVPVVTIFGIDFGTLLAGTIFTEKIFGIQGIGYWSLQALGLKNLPIIEATALFAAAMLIVSNIFVDVLYSVLDPRVRLS